MLGPSDAGLLPSQHLESYSRPLGNPRRFSKNQPRSSSAPARVGALSRRRPGGIRLLAVARGGASLRLDARGLDHLAPALRFGLQEGGHFGRRAAAGAEAEVLVAFEKERILH